MSSLRSKLLRVALLLFSNIMTYALSPVPIHDADDYPSKRPPTDKQLNH